MRWLRRAFYWLRFGSHDDELREELHAHRELLARDYRARGLSPADADAAARRAMGNETYMREESRAVWLWPRLEAFMQAWRYAWRGLLRSPTFTLVAVLSLALGIGANTAIFGLIHTILLARLPVPAAAQLVQLQRDLGAKGQDYRFSRREFNALANQMPLTMFVSTGATLDVNGAALDASVDAVDGRFFDLLGLRAQRGRLISSVDEAGAAQVVVVTNDFWRTQLDSDPAVLGRTIKIGGQPYTIVGITPVGFAGLHFPANTDVAIPYRTATSLGVVREPNDRALLATIVGRRAASTSIENARALLANAWRFCCANGELATTQAGRAGAPSQLELVDVSRGIPQLKLNLRGEYSRTLLALMAGVAILLLAACANVANLLLARSNTRMSELAVRLALGASRSRLVAQLVIESLQLSLLGALGGVLLAQWGTRLLIRANLGNLSGVIAPTLGVSVLTFTIVVSVACGLVFGVIPAVRVLRGDLITPLKQGGRRSRGRRRTFLDRGLVAVQMALALLLVSGAALLVQTLHNLQRTDLGFEPARRIALTVETRRTSYEAQGMTAQMAGEILQRVRAMPDVQSASFASMVPQQGGRRVNHTVRVRGEGPRPDGEALTWFAGVTPDYFTSLGIRFVAGHDVGATATGGVREVVVNDLFAQKFFPGRNPIGQPFQDGGDGDSTFTENRVVGVVASAKYFGLREPPEPMYFLPVEDHVWPYFILVLLPRGDGASLGHSVSAAIASVAPGIAIGEPTLISAAIDNALVRERVSATLATLFGAVALSLVAVGLYGVMLYQVAERTAEIGIRIALGARRSTVMALVLRQSLTVVAVGVIGGVPLAIGARRAVASQLYGVAPHSIAALLVAAGSLVGVGIIATLVPVRRALTVDPISALRTE